MTLAAFTRHLPAMYRRLGEAATYTPAGGGAATGVHVIFDTPGAYALDGMQQTADPSIRVQVSELPAVARGDRFAIGSALWKAREAGLPMLDGAELQVQLARA